MTPAPEVLTIADAAALLRVGPKVVRRLVRLKRIPHQVLDARGTVRISRAALMAFLEGGSGR
jgi:excisionase family DNA binding protein